MLAPAILYSGLIAKDERPVQVIGFSVFGIYTRIYIPCNDANTHQTHNIPWNTLASHLKIYWPDIPTWQNPSNLYFRSKDNQENDVRYFATCFAKTIREHTTCERKKFAENYDVSGKDDIILDDTTVQKTSPLVYKWRQSYRWDLADKSKPKVCMSTSIRKLCTHNDGFNCGCAIPFKERKVSSFLRRYYSNDCYKFYRENRDQFYNIELAKTLILYDEMEPILRVCSHPDVDYKRWHSVLECYDTDQQAGWDIVYISALNAYLCLNILYCFPALWDDASSTRPIDYRSTKVYQRTLRSCTWSDVTSEVPHYPHRAFFGIDDRQFREWPRMSPEFGTKYMPDIYTLSEWSFRDRVFPYGAAPIDDFLKSENEVGYLPDVASVALVRTILYSKGLPPELTADVMEKADYTVKRRLSHPHDPFHPGNLDELHKYLTYCWRLMVNCNMMADALGINIEWEVYIYRFLTYYISLPGHGSFVKYFILIFKTSHKVLSPTIPSMGDPLGLGSAESDDVVMTGAGNQDASGNSFPNDLDAFWNNTDPNNAFMLQNQRSQNFDIASEYWLNSLPDSPNPESFGYVRDQTLGPDIAMGNTLAASNGPVAGTGFDEQFIDPELLETPANVPVSSSPKTPSRTPTSRNSVRRVRAISDNFRPIAPSPTRETKSTYPSGFEMPPPRTTQTPSSSSQVNTANVNEPQQDFINMSIPEFQVTDIDLILANENFHTFDFSAGVLNGFGAQFDAFPSNTATPDNVANQAMGTATAQPDMQSAEPFSGNCDTDRI
ncbi:hypothetical protein TSTA_013570 [Talaromyces stipitatus ATCC 10500]|uniref:Uncharacterized protein n=1 Tax=Talaromyces stipitatus (strain ATCC 10500 / CBS 375.48 / QM 6759 / NRRL 1006) TaxID=441959 RepID=B8MGD7_TALSN|nr:uncharacterized protein TSTA_013570 [Talaromyces stipitatus ATCC 10500]EED16257.1 hypothetical protein TSTA_013570 [Talaromyces stipitatus ATCC 10500]